MFFRPIVSARKCYSFIGGRRFQFFLEHHCYIHKSKNNYALTAGENRNVVGSASWSYYLDFANGFNDHLKIPVVQNMIVIDNFVTEDEEKSLFREVEPYMKRLRYEFDHWDNAL